MNWQSQIREAAFSNGGNRIVYDYEDLSSIQEIKGTAFNFAGGDGTYIQKRGLKGRQFPQRVFFWGSDCLDQAQSFIDLVTAAGDGILEHPTLGSINVTVIGGITRRDDLKTSANQVVYELSFWETTGVIYPRGKKSPGAEVNSAIDAFNAAQAGEFASKVDTSSASLRARLKNGYTSTLGTASAALKKVASAQENILAQFNTAVASINQGIDVLIGDPLTLAFQTSIALQAPSRAAADIRARLSAYRNLAAGIIGGAAVANKNDFATRDLYASTYVTGSILSSTNNRFKNKNEALSAASEILDQFDAVNAWRDNALNALGLIDEGETYQALQNAAALAAGFLVEISFTLKQERAIVLDRPRSIIDLCAELYNQVDEQLDFFIQTNNLTGSEILEVPRGRRIVYYV